MLRVFRPKTGRTDTFPLTPSVGNALMDYLLKVRPDAGPERALFLRVERLNRVMTGWANRNLSTTLRHRRFLFTDSFLLLWKWRVG